MVRGDAQKPHVFLFSSAKSRSFDWLFVLDAGEARAAQLAKALSQADYRRDR
jgi:hypothetical protein